MTDDRNLQADMERAEQAARLLDNPLLADALRVIRDEVVRAWVECPQRDNEGKEALWQLAKTTDKFEALLKGYIETGKLAAANLRTLKEFEEKRGLRRVFG
jgi:hypothetical protein